MRSGRTTRASDHEDFGASMFHECEARTSPESQYPHARCFVEMLLRIIVGVALLFTGTAMVLVGTADARETVRCRPPAQIDIDVDVTPHLTDL